MIPPRFYVLVWVGPLVALGLVLVTAVAPEPRPKPWEYVTIGLTYGTFFGHGILAAAWTALGPLPLVWRLGISLVWLIALVVALAINMATHGPGGDAGILIVFGIAILGQWALAQVPLWGLVLAYGLQLRHVLDAGAAELRSRHQFGIRQLMILTAFVAIVLAVGRLIMPWVVRNAMFEAQALIIISFLAISGVVMMLPLLMAALLPRRAVPATLLVLLLVGLGTAAELPLLHTIQAPIPGGGPDAWHFFGINGVMAAWVLAVAGAMRLGGYGLDGQC